MIHETQTNLQLEQYFPNLENIDLLSKIEDEVIIYYHNSVPPYFTQEDVLSVLSNFEIKNNIKNKVIEFCDKNKIDSNTLGIHFRKTDFHHFLNEEETFNYINSNPETKFFMLEN